MKLQNQTVRLSCTTLLMLALIGMPVAVGQNSPDTSTEPSKTPAPVASPVASPAASLVASPAASSAEPPSPAVLEKQKGRIEDAKQVIEQNQKFQLHAQQLHAGAEAQIQEAKRLTGRAQQLNIAAPLQGKLSGAKLKGATDQYNFDLEAFKQHAREYAAHLADFRTTIGECHRNEAEYAETVRRHTLHCDEFHVPSIPPPHICGAMDISSEESRHLQAVLKSDQERVLQAEGNLRTAEDRLRSSINVEPSLMAKAHSANKRMEEERKIAGEFARLAEEHKALQIEHEFISGTSKVSTSSVKAKLKK